MAKSSTSSGKKWLLVVLLMVLVSSATAAGVYLLLDTDSQAQAAENAEPEPVEAPDPIFVKIDPFTVNISGEDYGNRFLYIGLTLQVADEKTRDLLINHMPQVRSRMLMLFADQSVEDLTSPDGKTRLSAEVLGLFDTPLTEPQPELAISDVLFTDFIVQ
ncbi:flagellar FliL protein [Onishia taeanensis]|jgi:flagellar FliL protein|uniref:Flagellar protein FliL n=1 Tax=Onishia taeanensis TaxID=284577 RepID=A0A1G7RDJ0_9GAMM|nr:flagellar basal body-associated protein FliL [Halomonas taeanensis]MAX33362.1 flagellar basal body-associated protein FliL [Halomonadaceae bacterium]SDG08793.1 flagellar FliL protein [Halomonas taeanensis]